MQRIILLAILLALPVSTRAEVYKCQTAQGQIRLQSEPCPGMEPSVDSASSPRPRAYPWRDPERRAQQEALVLQQVAEIGQRSLPPDYRIRIDEAIAQRLKDPDSRRIAYIGTPHGSAVCGTVNAKNSFGGYAGAQVFLAVLDTAGSIELLDIYTDERLGAVPAFAKHQLSPALVQRCDIRIIQP